MLLRRYAALVGPAEPARERAVLRAVAVGLALGLCAVAATAVIAALASEPNSVFTREPQVVLGGPYYAGALSNLTALVWAVPTVVTGLAASLCRGPERVMFAATSVLTAAMLADDLFLLHDEVYVRLGLPESLVQAAYLVGVVAIVVRFRRALGPAAVAGLALAVGLWGLAAGVDLLLNESPVNADQLTEDGLKLLGVAVWAGVWTAVVRGRLTERTGA